VVWFNCLGVLFSPFHGYQRLLILLLVCETELNYLDMTINSKKSSCIQVGPRHDKTCANIVTCDGSHLTWVDELRYLGIFIVRAPVFRCSLEHAKRSFHRAANGIFGKIGRIASEEVTIRLLKSKCLPLLLYALIEFSLSTT